MKAAKNQFPVRHFNEERGLQANVYSKIFLIYTYLLASCVLIETVFSSAPVSTTPLCALWTLYPAIPLPQRFTSRVVNRRQV